MLTADLIALIVHSRSGLDGSVETCPFILLFGSPELSCRMNLEQMDRVAFSNWADSSFCLAAALSASRLYLAMSAVALFLMSVYEIRWIDGEDRFRADQTRYVCGNPDDDSLPCIRRVADSSEPQAQGILTTAAIEL